MSRDKIPSAKEPDTRLEAQRLRLFEAAAVVSLTLEVARHGGSPIDGKLSQSIATHIQFALQLVERELNAVAEGLEPTAILEVAPTAKEIAAKAIDHMRAQETEPPNS